MRLASVAFAVVLLMPAAMRAQATPYLPVDDISYSYVDALMARGVLRGLSSLERPYHAGAVRAAIDSARSDSTSRVLASYLDALSHAIARYELRRDKDEPGVRAPFRAKATFDFYGTAQSSGLRELMLADWDNAYKPGIAGYFVMGGGHVAGSVRAILDNRLNTDPEFSGRKDRKIAGRTEDAYISGQWKYAEGAFGRVGRSWGPIGFSGLQLGDDAYTYDHLFARAGTRRLHISTVIARLDNYVLSPGVESSRYFSTHRFSYNRGGFELGVSESFIYSGVGRGLEFSLANPLNVYALSWRNERTDGNLSFGGDAAWKTRSFGTISAQLLLDDVQIDRCDTVCHEPSSYGLTLSAEGLPLAGDQRWFASWTRVSNLAYHTPNISERYAIYDVGLGRGFSDYDEIRIGADVALVPRTPLRLYVAYRRQGEGDYRKPYPDPADFGTTPGILAGTVWKTARAGLSGAAMVGRDFEIAGDGGVNVNRNRFNLPGVDVTRFEGRVRVTWLPRWLIPFDY
ncbi:MAG: hypothetical protein ABI681_10500 [Gemmatimonadales bacterium]